MRISFEWLKDFVDIRVPAEKIADGLTMAGLEVEGMEDVNGDTIFEVNVTPNRPDCLSILGIAREAAAVFGTPLKTPDTFIDEVIPDPAFKVEISDPELCGRYAGRLIEGVTVGDSPDWLKRRLEKCGIRSLNNNIVDITNYVLIELGHPLHAFDADKLSGNTIRVARAGAGRSIITLDGFERELPDEALLIWDQKSPAAIAGIMGGEESGVTTATHNIFLESACFSPVSIRRTSKKLGLRTESSYRFERGSDIEFLEVALNRAALLVKQICGGAIHEIVDVYPEKYVPKAVEISYNKVKSLLGVELRKDQVLGTLERIGIRSEDRGDTFLVYPQAFRRDICEYMDVLEEIARIYGYSNIPVRTPKTVLSGNIFNRENINVNKTKGALRKAGFTEVINYSFMNPSDLDLLSIPDNDIRRKALSIRNPLRQEDSMMRTSLAPSLINNFIHNFSRGIRDIRMFEISKIFIDKGEQLPYEGLRLGGIFYQERIPAIWKDDIQGFFIVKGALQALFEELKVSEYSFVPSEEVFLHMGKSADILLNFGKAGFIGELGPHVVETLDLKIHKPEIIIFEMDINILLSFVPGRLSYCQIPRYPSIERDIAVILDEKITSAEALNVIKNFGSEFIEKVELFDYYQGKNIPRNMKSLAFRIIYRSKERTLTDSEVESVHKRLVEYVLDKTGGGLRGQV
ncbi:MAG: phenylalanine--tRNA ligase subunit beta [Nitrospirota bacterium]